MARGTVQIGRVAGIALDTGPRLIQVVLGVAQEVLEADLVFDGENENPVGAQQRAGVAEEIELVAAVGGGRARRIRGPR